MILLKLKLLLIKNINSKLTKDNKLNLNIICLLNKLNKTIKPRRLKILNNSNLLIKIFIPKKELIPNTNLFYSKLLSNLIANCLLKRLS